MVKKFYSLHRTQEFKIQGMVTKVEEKENIGVKCSMSVAQSSVNRSRKLLYRGPRLSTVNFHGAVNC